MAGSSREQLIAAANDLFYQHGFHAVGLDQILDRVGVTKTTFYNHFESKDDLVMAVLEERDRAETEEIIQEMRVRGDGDPKREMLVFFDVIEEWLGSPDFRGCMFMKAASEYASPNDPVHRVALQHGESLFRQLKARAERAGAKDPEALASQLMLVLTGAILARQERGQVDQARSARAAAGVLVEAMC